MIYLIYTLLLCAVAYVATIVLFEFSETNNETEKNVPVSETKGDTNLESYLCDEVDSPYRIKLKTAKNNQSYIAVTYKSNGLTFLLSETYKNKKFCEEKAYELAGFLGTEVEVE